MEVKGTIFNIQHFSINDGPGIRTTVFFKGCPLNCAWCHNPESKSVKKEIMCDFERCALCGKCVSTCKNGCHKIVEGKHVFDREKCTLCGECVKNCLNDYLEVVGYEITAKEVATDVLKDKVFYETSGGGITLSGGEPLFQFDFAYEILRLAKENGLSTAIETCGYADAEKIKKIAPLVDVFLYDYKVTDSDLHKKWTGVDNKVILENLKLIDSIGGKIVLRCPIIPKINDDEEHFKAIAELANNLKNIIEINLEPYHSLGKSKAEKLGKEYKIDAENFVDKNRVEEWMNYIKILTSIPVKQA